MDHGNCEKNWDEIGILNIEFRLFQYQLRLIERSFFNHKSTQMSRTDLGYVRIFPSGEGLGVLLKAVHDGFPSGEGLGACYEYSG